MKLKNLITKVMVWLMPCAIFTSCDDDTDISYNFIGDSLIARWDLSASFPTRITYNYGVSGSGVEYLEQMSGKFIDKTVVVLSGTNDCVLIAQNLSDYADRYLLAINNLGGTTTYVISVLPRNLESDDANINALINEFNASVKEKIKGYPKMIYIDAHDKFVDKGVLNPNLSHDGLHINEYGYEILASIISKF